MKFATKPVLGLHYPSPHLRNVATLPRKIKNSNVLKIWKKTDKTLVKSLYLKGYIRQVDVRISREKMDKAWCY